MWDLVLIVPDLTWIDLTGQGSDATNLWGMLMLRPFSKGSLAGLFACYPTRNAYEPTLVVQGRLRDAPLWRACCMLRGLARGQAAPGAWTSATYGRAPTWPQWPS